MLGKRVTGSCRKLTKPSAISTMNSTSDGTGFRIDQAEMFQFMRVSPIAEHGRLARVAHLVAPASGARGRRRAGTCPTAPHQVAFAQALAHLDEPPAASPVLTRRVSTWPSRTTCTVAPSASYRIGGGRHREAAARWRSRSVPRREGADAQRRIVAEEDAHAAKARRLVDLRRDQPHLARDAADAGDLDARRLAVLDAGECASRSPRRRARSRRWRRCGTSARPTPRREAADARLAAADDAVGRRHDLGTAAPPVSSRRCASICAFSASATLRPSWAATSCASRGARRPARAGRRRSRQCGRRCFSGLARSKALRALDSARLGLHDGASAPGRWPPSRAPAPASFCASCASSVSATSLASTSPFFTRSPSSASTSMTRRPSTSGPTRISSRGTSEPVTSTVSTKSAGATRTTVTGAASCSSRACGAGAVRLTAARRASRSPASAHAATTTADEPFPNHDVTPSSRRLRCCVGRPAQVRHRIEQRGNQLQHGRHDRLGVEGRIDGAAPEHAVADHREDARQRRDVERRARCGPRPSAAGTASGSSRDEAVEALEDLADARIARRLQADLDAHQALVGRLLDEILLAQRLQRGRGSPAPAASAAKRSANSARSRSQMPAIRASLLSK